MSTLSPVGRYGGGRGWRRVRTAITLLIGLGALVGAGFYGYSLSRHDTPSTATSPGPSTSVSTPSSSCSPSPSPSDTASKSTGGSTASPSKHKSSAKTSPVHTSHSPSAESTAGKVPKPKSITLNVYNSTTRKGLARTTSTLLAKRGFTIGNVANDPAPKPVKTVAEVRYGPAGVLAARVVAAEVVGAKLVEDKRTSSDVDLALGAAFKHLASPKEVKAALSPSPTPSPSC
jgi:LytR cell envelope-related transcriptional attenuator